MTPPSTLTARRRRLAGFGVVVAAAAVSASLATSGSAAAPSPYADGGAVSKVLREAPTVQKTAQKSAHRTARKVKAVRVAKVKAVRKSAPLPKAALASTLTPSGATPTGHIVITAALFENKDYPYANVPAVGGDLLNMGVRQCTSYAAWALTREGVTVTANPTGGADVVGPKGIAHLGDAWDWDEDAAAAGFRVDNIPTIGAIAQWDKGQHSSWHPTSDGEPGGTLTAGEHGHVGVVVAVNPDGTARIRDYNGWVPVSFNEHSEIAARYIHYVN